MILRLESWRGSLTFLSNETFTTSRQPDHYHGNARVFDLNALAISLGTEARHAVQLGRIFSAMGDTDMYKTDILWRDRILGKMSCWKAHVTFSLPGNQAGGEGCMPLQIFAADV